MSKSRSLFSRLIWSVAIPEFIIFIIVGYVSYGEMKRILKEKSQQQSEALRSEISSLLDFQDFSIGVVERDLENRLELASWELRELFFSATDSIESTDLIPIRDVLGMDSASEDISIIREDGIIVNSTSKSDIGTNVFDFGKEFKHFIIKTLYEGEFSPEKFVLGSDKNLYKWSYQATKDHKYIIGLGVSSKESNDISDEIRKIISRISKDREEVISMEIFINPNHPLSYTTDHTVDPKEHDLIKNVFKLEKDSFLHQEVYGREVQTEYIYSQRPNSNLYESLVVRLIKDRTLEKELLKSTLYRKAGLFAFGLTVLFIILLINANFISKPIKLVSSAAKSLGSGHLSKRVPVMGNKELEGLASAFNQMAIDLEKSDKRIRNQKARIEEAHQEIKDSISYAKRIQAAILPPDHLVKEYLKNSFILYKPKDIVAGDFYWIEHSNDALLFAAADCTGHGVPGAMVSVICHNAMNRSVREFGLDKPSDILFKTREIVIEEFKRSEEEVMDGMDVALCSLSGNKLQFAGAHNPLWIIRNGELIEIKGSKQPIGVYFKLRPFENHEFELQEGDTFYLFSDGYADQFGGEKGRKFMSSRFKKLLLSIQSENMDNQMKKLNEAFEKWKGNEEQIDDVCVIGVKI